MSYFFDLKKGATAFEGDTVTPHYGRIVGWVVGVLVVLVLVLSSVNFVQAGEIGVKTSLGAVKGIEQPGLHFVVPFVQSIIPMDIQVQKEQTDATAASNDLQSVTATTAINFHIDPWDAGTIYQTIGADYQNRVIDPAIQESIKSVTANYTAEQLITAREQVREDILNLLTTKLAAYGIHVDSLNIVNFAFSSQFNSAIEAKVTAQQDALTAQNQVAQATAQASSTVIAAEAAAKQIEIQAAAINSQGGADYVELQAIKQWDGKLPTQMIPGETLPFINANSGN